MDKYEHGGDIYANTKVLLDFSVNTNPLGMPEEVRDALISRVDEFSRYPDPECRELRGAVAAYENVPEDFILCGNGAADLIHRLCRAVKPRSALVLAPTFSEYERALEQAGCSVTRHTLFPENNFEVAENMLERLTPETDMLFLCNPNNPTGRLINGGLLEKILHRAHENHILTVVDECFIAFTRVGVSAKKYLYQMPGLVVLKALTKTYALAGLRLGYMLASDKALLKKTADAGQCWGVSVPAQVAGVAARARRGLQEHAQPRTDSLMEATRRLVETERQFRTESLMALG
ncbi:MAG: aminotransferase class I/II-fold pyridoxal phosphate-dependent enzyme, partial [Clostridiales bacterium]|nr:aminotransferase class I/II-fold pyridoxal phosphate-dependent enzyme [Clostridiales bacterium]